MKVVFRHARLLPILTLIVALNTGCSESAKVGTVDDIQIGEIFDLDFRELSEIDSPFSSANISEVQSLFHSDASDVGRVRFFSAQTDMEDIGELGVHMALLERPAGLEGAFLAIVVGTDGVLYRSHIWGVDDPDSAWENFYRQFQYPTIRTTLDRSSTAPDSVVDQLWADLQAGDSDNAHREKALYRMQLLMRSNSYLIRRTMAMTGRGEVPETEWYQQSNDDFSELSDMAGALESILGETATAKFQEAADASKEHLQPVIAHAQAEDSGKLRDAVMEFRRHTCVACHNIDEHNLGEGDLNDAFFERLSSLGVRQDVYRVGFDVWAVPGEEEKSQSIANTIKAMLVLIDELPS